MKTGTFAILALALAATAPAHADTITNLNSPLPAGTSWGTIAGENVNGAVTISNAAPRSGNGSLDITGDRTRVQTGNQFGGAFLASNITSLDNVRSLTFDWQVAGNSGNQTLTPALRLLVQDGNQRSELIWEGAYQSSTLGSNGTAATNPTGQFYTSGANDLFHQFVTGPGNTFIPGTQSYVLMSIADWAASSFYTDSARVSGISVGAGSGAGANYHAFADNVTLTTNSDGARTYNFETLSATPVSPAPEPGTWAMMIGGFGMVGGTMRVRRSKKTLALA